MFTIEKLGEFTAKLMDQNLTYFGRMKILMESGSTLVKLVDESLRDAKVKAIIDPKNGRKFDAVIAMAVGNGEPGYYVARRIFNSSLVLYFAQQGSILNQDWALGIPHNPAILPSIGMSYE